MIHEPLSRHEKIALQYSGGKDSTAVLYLLREYLDRITVYHVDTGDLLPEVAESVARTVAELPVPNFVHVQTKVADWIAQFGLPTDMLPYSAHPIGYALGQNRSRLVPRYDCCWANLMYPAHQRMVDDGVTLIVRGTKRVDTPNMPVTSGEVVSGIEYYYPIQDWTHERVMAFLARKGVTLPAIYDYVVNSPECATCSAWWGERRREYLQRYHPELWERYDARLQVVINEIAEPLALLRREAGVT